MRMPSAGTRFELKEVKFEIVKSNGFKIKAQSKSDKVVIFNRKDSFTLFGTKFFVDGSKIKNKKISLTAFAQTKS